MGFREGSSKEKGNREGKKTEHRKDLSQDVVSAGVWLHQPGTPPAPQRQSHLRQGAGVGTGARAQHFAYTT